MRPFFVDEREWVKFALSLSNCVGDVLGFSTICIYMLILILVNRPRFENRVTIWNI